MPVILMDERSLYHISLAISVTGLIALSMLLPYSRPDSTFAGRISYYDGKRIEIEQESSLTIFVDQPVDAEEGDMIVVEGEERDGLIYPDRIFIRKNIIN